MSQADLHVTITDTNCTDIKRTEAWLRDPRLVLIASSRNLASVSLHHMIRFTILPGVDGAAGGRGRQDMGACWRGVEQSEVVAAAVAEVVPVSAVHGAVLQVVGQADAPLP